VNAWHFFLTGALHRGQSRGLTVRQMVNDLLSIPD